MRQVLGQAATLVRSASELATHPETADRVLPVSAELRTLLPWRGLRRGATVAIGSGAPGRTSLLLMMMAEASRSGSWCAVVGLPGLGLAAAAEFGVVLQRLALVPQPGANWPEVVAALLDGFDLVVVAAAGQVAATTRGQLAARARQRGSVLLPFGAWEGADVTLRPVDGRWYGLAQGYGRLRHRELTVSAQGRGSATRPTRVTLWPYGRPPVSANDIVPAGKPQLAVVR